MKLNKNDGDRKSNVQAPGSFPPEGKPGTTAWFEAWHNMAAQHGIQDNVLHDTDSVERKADHTTMKRNPGRNSLVEASTQG